jgi:hypothetical protein
VSTNKLYSIVQGPAARFTDIRRVTRYQPTTPVVHPILVWTGRRLSCRTLKKVSNEAADEKKPQAYPRGYVEDFFELRTKWEAFFSVRGLLIELLKDVAKLRQDERFHGETDGTFGAWCGEDNAPAEDPRGCSCHDGG